MFLYIDPGTGSMLFSIMIGLAASLFFLGKAALLKLKIFFSGKKNSAELDASYKPYVIYSEGNQYTNVFLPVVEEFEKRKMPLAYYTSAEDDEILRRKWKYVSPVFIGKGNAAFAKLNLLSAGVVLMTTPGLDVYQLKRSRRVKHYAHVLHAASDATMYRLFGIDFFDSVLLSGEYQKKDIRTLEKNRGIKEKTLHVVGSTYLDVLAKKIKTIPEEQNHPFTVLVSPSWGKSGLLSKYGERLLDPLAKTSWRIIVRPHPQSKKSESQMLKTLQTRYKNYSNIEWDFERDNIYAMKKADVMISDFSGIIFDFMFLCDKPVLYANAELDMKVYDAYWLSSHGKNIWQFETLEKAGIKIADTNFENIASVIENARDNENLQNARTKAKAEAWMFQGSAGKNIADFMTACIS